MDKAFKVMIVDDHPVVREGIKALISAEPDLIACCETGSVGAAQQLAREQQPDVAIVDLHLEDGSGLELTRRLRHHYADLKILVCSVSEDALFAERAVKAGANGYVNKKELADAIILAIRKVLAGKLYLSSAMVDAFLSGWASGVSPNTSGIGELSDRELDVFLLIGKGCSTSEIASQLNLSVKTVETHREKIKRKLGLSSGNQLIRRAVQWDLDQS